MAKSEEKPRPDVVWTLIGDGVQPRQAPFGFVVRNPVGRIIPPNGKALIKLGVASSVPAFVWVRGDMTEYATVEKEFVPAGREFTVVVENKSAHSSLPVDDLEVLLNVHPLIFRGSAEVG